MEVITKKAEQTKEGLGVIQKYKEKGATGGSGGESDFLLPGKGGDQMRKEGLVYQWHIK